ncbi:hypothetical protein SCATT_06290 [Streptantibioticus cattleyicolor NRRL 8057 = DSM 46488]|uniref:Uncharacterized protein n=1 Tax=Streptantibioticus cattleyicolor (strain ATCC 35852 / DSM 46488 / JCM 4925 / NBRC 14057 / NRRL 8057) TaxID=1003195 RepID=G8WTB7_STREN|nr:hypothetical protein SCATT_06290 [Streptantibioticus cattleyicolor NRRL 8057 = DSM 46488]
MFEMVVWGIPGPQGSKTPKGYRISRNGKRVPVLVESSAKVKPWREAVAAAARVRLRSLPRWTLLTEALAVGMHFTMPAPQRMPQGRVYPSVYPDLSKLVRSTEDALTGVVWKDDGLIVAYRGLSKTYPHLGPYALPRPGALLTVWTVQP